MLPKYLNAVCMYFQVHYIIIIIAVLLYVNKGINHHWLIILPLYSSK